MLKGKFLGFLVALLLAGGVGYLVVVSGTIPANADAEPGPVEEWIAATALQAALERQAPTGANPLPLTNATLMAGLRLYLQDCALCHGNAKGESAASWIARGEYPAPPQLATDGVEDDPEGWTFWKIKHGIRLSGMPSWKAALSDDQIWALTLFLKHMDKLPPAVDAVWKAPPALR